MATIAAYTKDNRMVLAASVPTDERGIMLEGGCRRYRFEEFEDFPDTLLMGGAVGGAIVPDDEGDYCAAYLTLNGRELLHPSEFDGTRCPGEPIDTAQAIRIVAKGYGIARIAIDGVTVWSSDGQGCGQEARA